MDFEFLTQTGLFRGMSAEEAESMLNCLQAEQRRYARGSFVYRVGDDVRCIGLVLSGRVQIETDDFWGNHSILSSIGPGKVFAETYACVPNAPMLVNAAAVEDSEILFLNVERVLKTCTATCPHHSRLIHNLLLLMAQQNLNLSQRMFHTSSKTIRGRLLAYLASEAQKQESLSFDIPFNRQQLADYLSVDRSALSAELGKMQKEGLISVRKSRFWLLCDIEALHAPTAKIGQ